MKAKKMIKRLCIKFKTYDETKLSEVEPEWKNTLVSGNADDKKNLHPGDHKYVFQPIYLNILNKFYT